MIANILAISLMIKVLSVENFGILSIALLIYGCALIFELQTSQSLQIYIPGYIKNNRTLSISNVLLISYILRQVAYPFIALIVYMFSQKLAAFYGIDIEIIWIICFGLLIRALASPLDFGNLYAFNKRIELSNQNFIETFSIILIIYILYSYSIRLEYFLILWMMRLLPVFIYSWIIYWHFKYKIKDKVSFFRSLLIIKKITKISFASFLLSMIGKISNTAPILISGGYFSLEKIAYFNYSTSLIRQYWGGVSYIETLSLSGASEKLIKKDREIYLNKKFNQMKFIASISVVFLVIYINEITLIFGKIEYLNSVEYFYIQVVAIFFLSFDIIRFNLYLDNKIYKVVVFALVKLIIEIAFCCLGIYYEDFIFLCYGFVIGPLFYAFMLFWAELPTTKKNFIPIIFLNFIRNSNFIFLYLFLLYIFKYDLIHENIFYKSIIFAIVATFLSNQYLNSSKIKNLL